MELYNADMFNFEMKAWNWNCSQTVISRVKSEGGKKEEGPHLISHSYSVRPSPLLPAILPYSNFQGGESEVGGLAKRDSLSEVNL